MILIFISGICLILILNFGVSVSGLEVESPCVILPPGLGLPPPPHTPTPQS